MASESMIWCVLPDYIDTRGDFDLISFRKPEVFFFFFQFRRRAWRG